MKALTVYFSAEGNTERYAKALAGALGTDLFAIVPDPPYTKSDLNWRNPLARCNREKIGKKDVPFEGKAENWESYDTVFLGFPIWYYAAPNVVGTFCRSVDWTGKRLFLFATSGGSDIGKTAEKLQPYLAGEPEILGAKVYRSVGDLIEEAGKAAT